VPAQRIDAIVTDAAAPAEAVREWRDRGVDVVTADLERAPPTPERVPELRRPKEVTNT